MLIEINTEDAKRLKIKINQLLIIEALKIKDQLDIKSLLEVNPFSESDFDDLVQKGILSPESKFKEGDISGVSLDSGITEKISPFDEFAAIYPVSVKRPDGTKDYLKGDIARCRKIYSKTVGLSRAKHNFIMAAIKAELNRRQKDGSIQYMKRMSKWLVAEDWTIEEDRLNDTNQAREERMYGTEVI
jgi:hypothetical protein